MPRLKHLDLRRLIISLAVVTGLIMLANSFYASYKAQEQILIKDRLQLNHAYATKVASATSDYLASAMQQLRYSAKEVNKLMDIPQALQNEVSRVYRQTESFDSVLVADATGKVLATAPLDTLIGKSLASPGAKEALQLQSPVISKPYTGASGNQVIVLSQPIFSISGKYLGYIGGSIYLGQANSLDRLLSEHYYSDGSYLFAVDQDRQLIYHPESRRVGTIVGQNPVVDAVLAGETGYMQARNSQGVEMLAGYAPLTLAGWGIVAQAPTSAALEPLGDMMAGVLKDTAIPALIILGLAWWIARLISRPLSQLAQGARTLDQPETAEKIGQVEPWYYEASQLKKAMLESMNTFHHRIVKLNLDAQTDALTGLLNRRGQEMALAALEQSRQDFSIVAVDIDHFKPVNDTWGHDTGDLILKFLADAMRTCSRDEDLLCRSGGEEFLMLLPATPPEGAQHVAERLRAHVDAWHGLPGPGHITISLGVTYWSPEGSSVEASLKRADEALYSAKKNGRNRVAMAR